MSEVLKDIRDADGNTFKLRFRDDGSGNLATLDYFIDRGSSTMVSTVSVTSTATTLSSLLSDAGSAVPSDRTFVEFQNLGSGNVYVGGPGVTTSTGRRISPSIGDGSWSLPINKDSDVYLISDSTASLVVTQFSVSDGVPLLKPALINDAALSFPDSPFTVTSGATYTGLKILGDGVPCVDVNTPDLVTFVDCDFAFTNTTGVAADIIGVSIIWGDSQVVFDNCRFFGRNPNVAGRYVKRAIDFQYGQKLHVQNCYFQQTGGIYVGDAKAYIDLSVVNNLHRNIEGRYSDGAGGWMMGNTFGTDYERAQFLQVNAGSSANTWTNGAIIDWNRVINDPGNSRPEDCISIHEVGGTLGFPIYIRNNLVWGAYPAVPSTQGFTGGGIMCQDGGASVGNIIARDNTVLNTTNYGIATAAGNDSTIENNIILKTPNLVAGGQTVDLDNGIYVRNAGSGHIVRDNEVRWEFRDGSRHNISLTNSAWDTGGNTEYPTVLTESIIEGEVLTYNAKKLAYEANPPSSTGERLWADDLEGGDILRWKMDGGGEASVDSGTGVATNSTTYARSGTHSLKMTIDTTSGGGGTRQFRWKEYQDNTDVIAEFWVYIPTHIGLDTSNNWFNFVQWKTIKGTDPNYDYNDPLWSLDIHERGGDQSGGNNYLQLVDFDGSTSYDAPTGIDLPTEEWFKVTTRFVQSTTVGSIQVWINDLNVFDKQNIATTRVDQDYTGWSINCYADITHPSVTDIYIDDVQLWIPPTAAPASSGTIVQLAQERSWDSYAYTPYTSGYFNGTNGTKNSDANFTRIGPNSHAFLLYQPKIPQGATITSAILRLYTSGAAQGKPVVTIYAADVDDALAPSNVTEALAIVNGALTTANVSYAPSSVWSSDYFNTGDLKTIVQEIVDRPGWTHDSRLLFVIPAGTGGEMVINSFDNWQAGSAQLTVSYT